MTAKPIDARQHTWWHRLRRLRWWGFTFLGGGLVAPLITVVLFGGVVWYYHYPLSTFLFNGRLIWIVSAPIYMGAFLWTWSHMEKRYHATLSLRCARCGHTLLHTAFQDRCPECGEPRPDADRG